ncbi:MAG: 30S ribosomal protein S4 [Chloroflexi bacterium]|nr:30S ribosomal protein S4 [Chloroflexota bacterium]
MAEKSMVKLSRRLGIALTPKAARIMAKKQAVRRPGRPPRGRRASDYKVRLLEKQRLRAQYDIDERQMRNYFDKARAFARAGKLNVSEALVQLLERRLAAVVHRSGLASTVRAAKQTVSHGHLWVNGKRVDLPSYLLKEGDVVSVRPESQKLVGIVEAIQSAQPVPYLELDKEKMTVKFLRLPERSEVPVICDLPMVVEFYSR